MSDCYWLDVRLPLLNDVELVALVEQVEALTRNARIQDNVESLALVARRLGELLDEVVARASQPPLF